MLNRLHVQNYKCLLDVAIEFGEFTVLIGPNDSGKSSLLEVIRGLARITREPYQAIFTGDQALANLVWRKETARDVVWEVAGTAGGDAFTYRVALPAIGDAFGSPFAQEPSQRRPAESFDFRGEKVLWTDGQQVKFGAQGQVIANAQPGGLTFPNLVHQAPFAVVAEALASTVEYHFEPAKLADASVPERDAVLHPSGDNLASVLDGLLTGADRSAFEAVEEALHAAIPTLQGIALRTAREHPGAKAVEFILPSQGKRPHDPGPPRLNRGTAADGVPDAGPHPDAGGPACGGAGEWPPPLPARLGNRPASQDEQGRGR
jgi:predicted ATPase